MSNGQDEATRDLLAPYEGKITSWARVEMEARDQDAEIYDRFIPRFQTDVEIRAYTVAFNGIAGECALEVGCGTGRTLATLPGKSTVGIDLSRRSLLLARARSGDNIDLIQASATHLPFRPAVFGQVLIAGVLNHIPGQEQRAAAIQEASRVLARPGRLVLSVHNYSWAVRRRFPREMVHRNLFWHRFTPEEIESLLRGSLGHSEVKLWGICCLPRWRVGNRLGPVSKWLDVLLSQPGWLSRRLGTLLVARADCLPWED
ncbi:MAG: class I SAM-dependent methyltransferase [Chloroflexi bacterium]|nr:class I SAM-dependent methyltransferase [Chloroflexota bacterium]